MTNTTRPKRIDTVSGLIKASPEVIYQAFLNPEALAAWRPPEGMTCKVYAFDPHEGGSYRMAFIYDGDEHGVQGKTSAHEDVFEGRFVELKPNEQIVEAVDFESDDPAFSGTMTMTTLLKAVPGGTKVTFIAEDVPEGIKPHEHYEGMTSSLHNLAKYTEQVPRSQTRKTS